MNRAMRLLFVSRVERATKFTYTRAFDRISSRPAIRKLEPRRAGSPKWHFPRRVHIRFGDIDALTYTHTRLSSRVSTVVFPPGKAIGDGRMVSLRAQVMLLRRVRNGTLYTRRVGDATVFALGKSGQIPVYTVTKRTTWSLISEAMCKGCALRATDTTRRGGASEYPPWRPY